MRLLAATLPLALALGSAAAVPPSAEAGVARHTLYVSPAGDDAAAGTRAAPS